MCPTGRLRWEYHYDWHNRVDKKDNLQQLHNIDNPNDQIGRQVCNQFGTDWFYGSVSNTVEVDDGNGNGDNDNKNEAHHFFM